MHPRSLRVTASAVLQEPMDARCDILGSSDTNYEDFAADQLAASPRRRGKSVSFPGGSSKRQSCIREALKLNLDRGRRLRRRLRRRRCGESARPLAQSQEHTPSVRMRPDC